jgi:hypothetical protein
VRYHWELRPAEGEAPTILSYRPHRVTRLIAALRSLGMAVDTGPPPRFPLWALYGVSDFDSAGRPLGERAADYEAALARILRHHGHTDEPGIPIHKLRTNLGWHVTAAECRAAVDAFQARQQDEPAVFGGRLLPFLRKAAAGDGFEVH